MSSRGLLWCLGITSIFSIVVAILLLIHINAVWWGKILFAIMGFLGVWAVSLFSLSFAEAVEGASKTIASKSTEYMRDRAEKKEIERLQRQLQKKQLEDKLRRGG